MSIIEIIELLLGMKKQNITISLPKWMILVILVCLLISLKIDEKHPNDDGFYAFNENPIDFLRLYMPIDGKEEEC